MSPAFSHPPLYLHLFLPLSPPPPLPLSSYPPLLPPPPLSTLTSPSGMPEARFHARLCEGRLHACGAAGERSARVLEQQPLREGLRAQD